MPVAAVPRGALLDLDIEGPDGQPAFLLPRVEIAEREADYLLSVAREAELEPGDRLEPLLRASLSYAATRWSFMSPDDLRRDADAYLLDGLGRRVVASTVDQWIDLDLAIAHWLRPFSDFGQGLSPTEHPLLSVPFLDEATLNSPDWEAAITCALTQYLALVSAASVRANAEGAGASRDLLTTLADYGRDYDLLVVTEVPLDEPFLLKYSERRPVSFSWWRNSAHQDLIISDARSNHVALVVSDPNVRIVHVRATAYGGTSDAFGSFARHSSGQTYAVYVYGADRDYRVTLRFRLAPLHRLQLVVYLVTALLIVLGLAVIRDAPRQLQDLALIIGPSALAASVLLNREPSTLGSHLRRRGTAMLLAAVAFLLLAGVASYLGLPAWGWMMAVLSDVWSCAQAAVSVLGATFDGTHVGGHHG